MPSQAFLPGARGFLVARLQQAIGVSPDGIFGPRTLDAVSALQSRRGLPFFRSAGPGEFEAAGLEWPDEFSRCLALVSLFEGTGFGDMNTRDIDGQGVTLGIVGFTTTSGEVQELFAQFFRIEPNAADDLDRRDRNRLTDLLHPGCPADEWNRFFYDSEGNARKPVMAALKKWGRNDSWKVCQVNMARTRFWKNAVATSRRLGFQSPRARLFFLDVAVQDGGWRHAHQLLAKRLVGFHSSEEPARLEAAARAVASCAKETWRGDVYARKLAIAAGRGVVHGITFTAHAQAIE